MKYEDYIVLLINTVIQDRENLKQAFRQGKTIQWRARNNKTIENAWHTSVAPIWRFDLNEYRVKPITSKTDIVHDTWKRAKADPNYKTGITLKVVDMDTGEDMEIPKGSLPTFWNMDDYDNDAIDEKVITPKMHQVIADMILNQEMPTTTQPPQATMLESDWWSKVCNDNTDEKPLTVAAAKFQIQTLAEDLGFVVEDRHIRVIGNDQKVDSTPKKPRSHMRQANVVVPTDKEHLEAQLQALDKRLTEVEDTINS